MCVSIVADVFLVPKVTTLALEQSLAEWFMRMNGLFCPGLLEISVRIDAGTFLFAAGKHHFHAGTAHSSRASREC